MELIIHHMATLCLMFLSWMINFTRVGTLVMLVHDCVDPIMEVSMLAYMCVCVCVCVCVCFSMYVSVYMCVYACMHVCVYVFVFLYVSI